MPRIRTVIAAFAAATMSIPAAHAIDISLGGSSDVELTIGSEIAVEAGAEAGAEVNAGGGAEGEVPTSVMLMGSGQADVEVTASDLVNQTVTTTDGTEIGVLAQIVTGADGEAVFIVDISDDWMGGTFERIGVRASAIAYVDQQLVINTTDEDLQASIAAGMEAGAAM